MKKIVHPFDETAVTAWIFMALLAALILVFAYLFYQRISGELALSLQQIQLVGG